MSLPNTFADAGTEIADKTGSKDELHAGSNTEHPNLRLLHRMEAWSTDLDEFAFWGLVWADGEDYFHYRHPYRQLPEDPCVLFPNAHKIPRSYYMAPISILTHTDSDKKSSSTLTRAPDPPPEGCFIKTFNPVYFDPDQPHSTRVADSLIHEARVCEKLKQHPQHRNVGEYYGYIEKGGLVTGLCFRRYGKNLGRAVEDGDVVDVKNVVEGVRSGLEHIHGLGLVHVGIILLTRSLSRTHVN